MPSGTIIKLCVRPFLETEQIRLSLISCSQGLLSLLPGCAPADEGLWAMEAQSGWKHVKVLLQRAHTHFCQIVRRTWLQNRMCSDTRPYGLSNYLYEKTNHETLPLWRWKRNQGAETELELGELWKCLLRWWGVAGGVLMGIFSLDYHTKIWRCGEFIVLNWLWRTRWWMS